ncbi:MAG: tetratricopeptide repeat protein [Phycisphaerae bacterium]|nr:tetratricopeptide repeat protein [Phycisphaerae bacterium]
MSSYSQNRLKRAMELHRAGKLPEAEALYRSVIAADPNVAEAWQLLGLLHTQSSRPSEAVEFLRRAIALNPHAAHYYVNYANALRLTQQHDAAIAAARKAIDLRPTLPSGYNILGVIYRDQQELEKAITAFERAVQLAPDSPDGWANLGLVFVSADRFSEAIRPLQRALSTFANHAELHHAMGRALGGMGEQELALAEFEQARTLEPAMMEAYQSAAVILIYQRRLTEAIELLRNALQINPENGVTHANLANALNDQGYSDAAAVEYDKAVTLSPDVDWIASARCIACHYRADVDPKEIFWRHREWNRLHAEKVEQLPGIAPRTFTDRKLRIGYVSPDFRRHAVAFFLSPLVTDFDREALDVFCYSNSRKRSPDDEHTDLIRSGVTGWRDIATMSDDAGAQLIRDDQIDILVDLAGHTAFNRLRLFARKPAPIQMTYLGYPNTTGMPAIDYRITDAFADPPGISDELNVEKLLRLEDCAWCYRPIVQSPQVQPPPSQQNGFITFGSFNVAAKLNERTLHLWADVLERVPSSRFVFKAGVLNDANARKRITNFFASRKIHGDRIQFQSAFASLTDHLAYYSHVDIALDPFPYNGTTTTCDAMWMGVPVITLAGNTHVSRVGCSLLHAVGLDEMVADSSQQYLDIAAALAEDGERLKQIRGGLRDRMIRSPLGDVESFAKKLRDVYRAMMEKNIKPH